MNGEYQIFKRDKATGKRDVLVQRYTSFTINLNWGEVGKFTIKGETVESSELDFGDYILFYRNNELVFSGVVTDMSISCSDPETGYKKWTATGKEDSVIFSYRINVPDPWDMTFHDDYSDTIEDYGHARLVHYIRRNMGDESNIMEIIDISEEFEPIVRELVHREIDGLLIPAPRSLGKNDVSSYRYKALNVILNEIGKETNSDTGEEWGLYPKYVWDSETGEKRIEITQLRDRTAEVLISPILGNVTSWSKSSKFPKYNALWVVSGSWSDDTQTETIINKDGQEVEVTPTTRIYVYYEDKESIAKFGRIEKVETKSDIKVVKEKEEDKKAEEEEDEDEEKEDKTVSEEQVRRLLAKEARKLLKENAATTKYKISMVETPQLQYWDDWRCGDLVSCEIEGERFQAIIKTVEITYEKGMEKVKPTVGEVEEGEFAEIFKRMTGMDTRLSAKELEM